MAKIKKFLFYYNLLFTVLLLLSGFLSKSIFKSPKLAIVLVSLTVFFWGYLLVNSKKNKLTRSPFFWVFVSLLLLFNFLATSLLFVFSLGLSRSVVQVLFSVLYLPYPIYFLLVISNWYQKLRLLKPKGKAVLSRTAGPKPMSPIAIMPEAQSSLSFESLPLTGGNLDQNRRQFLKLIGTTGVGFVLVSLLNPKKAGAAFFGSVPGPGTVGIKDSLGDKIDPAIKQPTDGYKISQLDDISIPAYYGYINKDGAWYIMSEDSSGNYRYVRGGSDFVSSWADREDLDYDYFDNVF